jgi:hypothetical protein
MNQNNHINITWRRNAYGASIVSGPRAYLPRINNQLFHNQLTDHLNYNKNTAQNPENPVAKSSAELKPASMETLINFTLKPAQRGHSLRSASQNAYIAPDISERLNRGGGMLGRGRGMNHSATLAYVNHTIDRAISKASVLNKVTQSVAPPPETSASGRAAVDNTRAVSAPNQRKLFEQLANDAAVRHGVDPNLVKAVITAESDYDPNAVSRVGAMGLMQLMPETARDMNVHEPFDPAQNIEGGAKYLAQLSRQFNGDETKILAAYNWGPGNVQRGGKMPLETQNYLLKVRRFRDSYRQLAQKEQLVGDKL